MEDSRNMGSGEGPGVSRRAFGLSVVGGAAAVGVPAPARAAVPAVVDADVQVQTPDGICDAVLAHPATGAWPSVLIWPDAFGLRPAVRDMARRLAGQGYTVFAPNPFYRTARAPVFPAGMDFNSAADRAKLTELRKPLTSQATMRDAVAFATWLDDQKAVNIAAKMGVQGYCMGGPMVFQTAAVLPARIGGAVTCHGGGLVSDMADSPHLLIPMIKAAMYCAVASNDDMTQPNAKTVLRDAFAANHVAATVEVYPGAMHGWCMPDQAVYNKDAAERAWAELSALYKRTLI